MEVEEGGSWIANSEVQQEDAPQKLGVDGMCQGVDGSRAT